MQWNQIVSGGLLVGALTALAGIFAWRQVLLLSRLRGPHGLSGEEARWRRGQAWRRLVGCGLMLGLAVLLAAALLYLENPAQHIADQGPPADTPVNRQFLRVYGAIWITILLFILAVVLLAAADIWSTRRFSLHQKRKILDDRRAMLEREVARYRQERNGKDSS